jgi:hypothetical protein
MNHHQDGQELDFSLGYFRRTFGAPNHEFKDSRSDAVA